MTTMKAAYQAAVADHSIEYNTYQWQVIEALESLARRLEKPHWINPFKLNKGIYLYGPVGSGKTYLMDLFYQSLAVKKTRMHFHGFMQSIDKQLRGLTVANPLKKVALQWSKTVKVLCLDELLVEEIAHAMIIKELFQAFINQGIVLIMTANIAPNQLYQHSIYRDRFLPAINLIHQYCTVISLDTQKDYRLNRNINDDRYLYPITYSNYRSFANHFINYAKKGLISSKGEIAIQNRNISFIKRSQTVIWFDFNSLCNIPRSSLDYLELTQRFETIMLSKVPVMVSEQSVEALLFIQLTDICYDKNCLLVLLAADSIDGIYSSCLENVAVKRSWSRLKAMQAKNYKNINLTN